MVETMMVWIFPVCGLLALLGLGYLAVRNHSQPAGVAGAIEIIRSIDIEAFRILLDPSEEQFLRSNLPPSKFRRLKRERAWAALAYVRLSGRAAIVIARAAQDAQRSSDPEVVASGAQIAAGALRLRWYSLQATARLLAGLVLPGTQSLSHPPLLDLYDRTTETLLQLGRLQAQNRG